MAVAATASDVVTKRDLNQKTAQVLARVTPDHPVTVSERGEPRWKIVAYQEELTGLERLAALGLATPPAETPVRWPEHTGGPTYTSEEFDALLEEMKGEY